MALLEVSNLGIAFGGLQAVAQLDLSIEKATCMVSSAPTARARRRFSIC